jgi:hypothetical protein
MIDLTANLDGKLFNNTDIVSRELQRVHTGAITVLFQPYFKASFIFFIFFYFVIFMTL